jgi:hypothetical protein
MFKILCLQEKSVKWSVCVSECIILYVDTERAYNFAVFNGALCCNVIFDALLHDALLFVNVHLTNKKILQAPLNIPLIPIQVEQLSSPLHA